jgi:hypothetical protein
MRVFFSFWHRIPQKVAFRTMSARLEAASSTTAVSGLKRENRQQMAV